LRCTSSSLDELLAEAHEERRSAIDAAPVVLAFGLV